MRKEPAVWISLIGAVLAVAIGFGLHLSGVQVDKIMELATVLVPLIMGGTAMAIRTQVYSPDSVQTALNMPQGSSPALLDRVIETSVDVKPGDSKADVHLKVATAEAANE